MANTVLGSVATDELRLAEAKAHFERSIAIGVALGLEKDVFTGKLNLASVELDAGDFDKAELLLEEVLAYHHANDSAEGIGFALLNLGQVSHGRGDLAEARKRFAGALVAFEQIDFREHVADALLGLAAVEAAEGCYEEAARLFGRAEPILREVGVAGYEPALVAKTRAQLEEALGPEAFGALLTAGRNS